MSSAQDLITDALQLIGEYAPGEAVSAADLTQCLSRLNRMIDSWSNESLTCFQILEQSGAMVVGQSQYTIGTGGNFNMARPLRLIDGPGAAYLQDTNFSKYGVNVRPRDQWNLISNPITVTSNVPTDIFYDPQFPLGIINVWPVPNITWTLFWDSYLQLTDFASLGANVSLPPGYEKAITDNLALEISPYFKPDNWQPPVWLVKSAAQAKGAVKRTNYRPNVAVYDREIVARGNGTYNIYSDRG